MKKLITIILSVLLIASLFVSCDNATKAVQDELAEVALSTQASSRSLTVSNPLEDLSAVSWTYTARKVSENQFNYGEKTSETNIDLYPASGEKQKLTLSQGKWVFELFGRSTDGKNTLLYHGITGEVLILRSNGLNQITVEVSPYTSATGTLKLSNIVVNLNTPVTIDGSEKSTVAPNYLYVTGPENYSNTVNAFNGTKELTQLKAGQYTVTVKFVSSEDSITYAEETVIATVYSGRTTTVGGNLSEETGSGTIQGEYVDGNTSVVVGKVEEGKDLVLVSSVVPVDKTNNSEANTTVTFPAGAIDGSSAQLSVEVKGVDSNFIVTIPSEETESTTPIASIDLSVKVGDTKVSSFNGKSVKVETYILKNLDSTKVKVSYNGEFLTDSNYDPVTGKLTFTTNHFSKFDVLSNAVCYNENTNIGYNTFETAVNNSSADDTIIILKDIENVSGISIENKKINGRGHRIKASNNKSVFSNIEHCILEDIEFEMYVPATNCDFMLASNINSSEFKNVDIYGKGSVTGNVGAFCWKISGTNKFEGCDIYATMTGGGHSTNYNSAFFGIPQSGAYITMKDCTFAGSLKCGSAALFVANPCYGKNITLDICNVKNKGLIQTVNVDHNIFIQSPNQFSANVYDGSFSFYTIKLEGNTIPVDQAINNEHEELIGEGGYFVFGPEDSVLAITVDPDTKQFVITPSQNENVEYYEVAIGTYVSVPGGSNRNYIFERVEKNGTLKTDVKKFDFVDHAWVTNHPEAIVGTLGGHIIYSLGGDSYYLVEEEEFSTKGLVKAMEICAVSAFDVNGNLLASSSFNFNN